VAGYNRLCSSSSRKEQKKFIPFLSSTFSHGTGLFVRRDKKADAKHEAANIKDQAAQEKMAQKEQAHEKRLEATGEPPAHPSAPQAHTYSAQAYSPLPQAHPSASRQTHLRVRHTSILHCVSRWNDLTVQGTLGQVRPTWQRRLHKLVWSAVIYTSCRGT